MRNKLFGNFYWLGLVPLVLGGCGTGTYEDKFQETLSIQKKAQAFVGLEAEPRPVPGTSKTVRLPKPVKDSWQLLSGDDANRGKASLLADLPEVAVYESWGPYKEENKTGEVSMFCHIGSIPLTTPDAKFKTLAQVEEAIVEKAGKGGVNHGALEVGARVDEAVETPPMAGGAQPPLGWRRIQLKGKTAFERKPQYDNTVHPGVEDSVIDLWLHEYPTDNPEQVVVILWRVPYALGARQPGMGDEGEQDPVFDILEMAPLTAGSLKQASK